MARKSKWQRIFEELLAQVEKECVEFRAKYPEPKEIDWPQHHNGFVAGLLWVRDTLKAGANELSRDPDVILKKRREK